MVNPSTISAGANAACILNWAGSSAARNGNIETGAAAAAPIDIEPAAAPTANRNKLLNCMRAFCALTFIGATVEFAVQPSHKKPDAIAVFTGLALLNAGLSMMKNKPAGQAIAALINTVYIVADNLHHKNT